MAIELEKIKAWDGQSGTGADARGVIDRNFEKVKDELEAVDAKFSDVEDEIVQLAGDVALKADHGYSTNPKSLKQVDDLLIKYQNIISNGNFADGTTSGWSVYNN